MSTTVSTTLTPTLSPTSHRRSRGIASPPLAATCLDLLDRARQSLLLACRTGDVGERYVEAHLGALRAAAAVLAARSLPGASGPDTREPARSVDGPPAGRTSGPAIRTVSRRSRSRPRSVWELLPRVAPELTEWSAFFAASARRRAAVERGGHISVRESDDLLRQAEIFLEIVQGLLGLPHPDALTPISLYVAPTFRPHRRHEHSNSNEHDHEHEHSDGS